MHITQSPESENDNKRKKLLEEELARELSVRDKLIALLIQIFLKMLRDEFDFKSQ